MEKGVAKFNCGEGKEWVNLLMGRNWLIGVPLPATSSLSHLCLLIRLTSPHNNGCATTKHKTSPTDLMSSLPDVCKVTLVANRRPQTGCGSSTFVARTYDVRVILTL